MNEKQLNHYKQVLKKAHGDIDPQATGIIKRLKDAGFEGYLVGGCVRDLLVGLHPKDFDIATSALPNEVKKKVPYCFVIGRRFKLVHARRGEKIFEIATYRREATQEELESSDMVDLPFTEENFFGNIKEDSFRRDFTINALFYDPISEDLVDYCEGLSDMASHTLRMIGNPMERIKEDPIRILRAIRLSQKLTFRIEHELRHAIHEYAPELSRAVLPRRREEWVKFFRLKSVESALWELFDLQIFKVVLPSFDELFHDEEKRENFLAYLRKIEHIGFHLQDPVELFAAVIYSFLLAEYGGALQVKMNEISENPKFQIFCRDELGVFKAELMSIVIAIQHIYILHRQESYMKKGERRQRALLNNANFDLALKLGLLSGELTTTDFVFWMQEKKRFNQPQSS